MADIERLTDDEMVARGMEMQQIMSPIGDRDAMHLCLVMASWAAVQFIDEEKFIEEAREAFASAQRRYRERTP